MPSPVIIDLYSDVHCPYAYVAAYRLRQLRAEYRGTVTIRYKSLALEYVNHRATPKPILDNETPILMLEEPEIPYQPWHAPLSQWPVTMWPAFEAIFNSKPEPPPHPFSTMASYNLIRLPSRPPHEPPSGIQTFGRGRISATPNKGHPCRFKSPIKFRQMGISAAC